MALVAGLTVATGVNTDTSGSMLTVIFLTPLSYDFIADFESDAVNLSIPVNVSVPYLIARPIIRFVNCRIVSFPSDLYQWEVQVIAP